MSNLFTKLELARFNLTLNSCPNCKSIDITIGGDDFDGDVMCNECKLVTPVCYGTKGAILTWNKAANWQTAWDFLKDNNEISDSERLDWLQKGHSIVASRNSAGKLLFSANFHQEVPDESEDVRIAIDKAIVRGNDS